MLGGVVEKRRAGVILGSPRRPRRLEHLVRDPSEQNPAGAPGQGSDRLAHLRIKAVFRSPGRGVDDAIEADELVDVYLGHESVAMLRGRAPVRTGADLRF